MSTGRLVLSNRQRRVLTTKALAAAPEECCGILIGRALPSGERLVSRIVPTTNVATGDRRRGYAIDERAVLAAWRQARATGERLVGFYHSHPRGGERPSVRDRADAWPDASYLILAPRETGWGLASWRLAPGGDRMTREEVAA